MDKLLEFGITCFISMLAIINPLSTIGLFLSLMRNVHPVERHKIALQSSIVSLCVLVFFAMTGYLVFQVYGITIEAFRIAGGMVLLLIGMRMLFPSENEHHAPRSLAQAYLVPLAIPMTSGPGAITTAVVLASQAQDFWFELALAVAILLACLINYVVLRFSDLINREMGPSGVAALTKVMGLLVCAVGVQFMLTGLKVAFPILAGAG